MIDVIWDMETGDPDDFFTLILLLGHPKVNLKAVTITPGSEDQVGLVRKVLKDFNRDILVGAFNIDHPKQCVSGWYHKVYGAFGTSRDALIGSECKKGQLHYIPTDEYDFLDDCVNFWSNEDHLNVSGGFGEQEGMEGVLIKWDYSVKVKNESLRGTTGGTFEPFPGEWGRGEWVAKTLEDAKQMACDFSRGVS